MAEGGNRGAVVLGGGAALALAVAGYAWWALWSAPPAPVPDAAPKPEAPAEGMTAPVPQGEPAPVAVPKPASQGDRPEAARPAVTPEPAPRAVGRENSASEGTAPAMTGPDPKAPVAAAPETTAPETTAKEAKAAEPTVSETPAPETTAPETKAPDRSAPATTAPVVRYDALRVTPEGALTLAGQVAPGATVDLLLDGAVIAQVTANAQGAFAALADIAPSAAPRGLQLRVTGADGTARLAKESLTVAPSPLALAQAATAQGAAPETVADAVEAAQVLAEKPLVMEAGTGAARVLAGQAGRLVIDTLAFAPDGTITLSGRGAPKGALLRAYLDTAEAGLIQAGDHGDWSMRLPAVGPGHHLLRVDALDAAGKVLARAEQGFEGVAAPDLQAAARAAAEAERAKQDTAAPQGPNQPAPAAETVAPDVAAQAAPGGAAPPNAGTVPRTRAVTIAPGNTLWAIARETYGDPFLYVRIFEANRDQIRDPDRIYPGQVFALPR